MLIMRIFFYFAFVFYTASFFALFFKTRENSFIYRIFFIPALILNLIFIVAVYYFSWPLMPMYHTPFFLPFFIGIFNFKKIMTKSVEALLFLFIISLISFCPVFFPKDFYHPFWISKSIFSHIFFIFGVLGKAGLISGGVFAVLQLKNHNGTDFCKKSMDFIITGFALWTISMFSGELWSWMGWGAPIVWDDASIITAMATWFYFMGFLHLHLMGNFTMTMRAKAAVFGMFILLILSLGPDLGPFRIPDIKYATLFLRGIQ